jgi:hypothetical protein
MATRKFEESEEDFITHFKAKRKKPDDPDEAAHENAQRHRQLSVTV